ncbi:MAG: substrate-binding periplasmic protein [Desulfovibrionaceae bacterium]
MVLSTDPWAPFYHPDLEDQGFFTELARRAFRKRGYAVDIDFTPWKRALKTARFGQSQGVLGAYYKTERTLNFMYSDVVSHSELVFYALAGSGVRIESLEDLRELRVGAIRGYHYTRAFDEADFFVKEPVDRLEQNIEKLVRGRIDAFVASSKVTRWILSQRLPHYADLLEKTGPPLDVKGLYVLISRAVPNRRELIEDFNAGLAAIRENGEYAAVLREYGLE